MDTNIIYNIDCVAGMNQMIDEESIDLIIADPDLHTAHSVSKLETTAPQALQDPN